MPGLGSSMNLILGVILPWPALGCPPTPVALMQGRLAAINSGGRDRD